MECIRKHKIILEGIPIGECWLQKMNIGEITREYRNNDIRRIDISIGEKDYWNKGFGTKIMKP
ncbi:MAG: hypothetical protein LBC71_01745 [Oscillospiraceae bacterium]|jgi:RimJ/RimL family protein N-acetyltransferase|nr:hypothetical protein [Oscillospiraceae bacterium]